MSTGRYVATIGQITFVYRLGANQSFPLTPECFVMLPIRNKFQMFGLIRPEIESRREHSNHYITNDRFPY